MATIRTAIQVTDGMSPAFRSMNNAMNIVLSSFEALQSASGNAIDTASIHAARAELNKAEIAINGVESEIEQARQAQEKFNGSIRDGGSVSDGLMNKIKGIAMSMGAAFGAKKIIDLADTMTQTKARLDLMNDGLQTTEQLQNKIMESANRSRASYQTTADAVSKLGLMAKDAFSSTDEIIAFSEQINKQFTIAGTSAAGVDAAMLQLTQAMASGVLRGEELNSIFEQAPTIVQAIADHLEVPIGSIRAMAAEGQITADIVKQAMFATADETNAKFAQMPMTFGQVITMIQNMLLQTFEPVIQLIGRGAEWIYENWSTLEPMFWGLASAVAFYAVVMGYLAAATWLAEEANKALVVQTLSNPVLWIAIAIGVLIAMIYKWVKSVGGLEIAWKIAMNGIMTAWDWVQIGFMTGAVAVQNFVGAMSSGVLAILQNMVNGAINIINDFIGVLNNIPGVSIDAISQVSFGTTAQMKHQANKMARSEMLDSMKMDAIAATATRQAEISAMKTAVQAKNNNLAVDYDSIANNIEDTAGNTAAMKDSMEASEEELKYLREIAEAEAINRFTTAEIKLEMTNTNNINSDMDLDGMVTYLEEKLYETMVVAAEGVYD